MPTRQQMWDMPLASAAQRGREPDPGEKHIPHWFGWVAHIIVGTGMKILFRYDVEGIENIRQFDHKGGCVIASTHASYADPIFVWLSARPKQWMRFMARENMFEYVHGASGWIISMVGAFPVKRDTADRTSIKRAATMLKRGEIVALFPEGSRRGKSKTRPSLHGGAAFIARMGKAPMVPCGIRNVEKIKDPGKRMHFPHVTIVYGPAVYLEDFDFLPREDRVDAASWYVMREAYALKYDVPSEQVDMDALFPGSRNFSKELEGHVLSRKAVL
jgi:1-acyl-sn-glycerol-3-phosphate acyltransferase